MPGAYTAYVNGDFLPLDEARVPVLDRGFLFADSVYEMIPVYAGRIFLLKEHLQRLHNSLAAIHMSDPLSPECWEGLLSELVQRNGGGNLNLYLQVTRGAQDRRDHRISELEPTIVAFPVPAKAPSKETFSQGIAAITFEDRRRTDCHIKANALLPNILAVYAANQASAEESLLLHEGKLTEGASSNVFTVIDDIIVTPPKQARILPGITRDLILRLIAEAGLEYAEREISENELRSAQELWITSSTRELYPVTSLDGEPVGDGNPGPLWRRLYDLIQEHKDGLQR